MWGQSATQAGVSWAPSICWSEYRTVFTGKHDPHCARVLGINEHPNADSQPHVIATTTHYLLTEGGPAWKIRHSEHGTQNNVWEKYSGNKTSLIFWIVCDKGTKLKAECLWMCAGYLETCLWQRQEVTAWLLSLLFSWSYSCSQLWQGGITCETVTVYVVEKTGSYRVTFYFEAISHHALE